MNRLNFEQEKQLIDYFRDNPSLWNTKDKDYNNRMLRTQKLEGIATFLQLTRKDVYEKYRNLRTTFFREHKRVDQSAPKLTPNGQQLPPGEQAALPYVSKWRHYQNMLFLTKVDKSHVGGLKEHANGNNSLHNEDSNASNEPPLNHHPHGHHLNNGHDIELVIDNVGTANNRPQPMDTSGDNHNDANSSAANAPNNGAGLSVVQSAVTSTTGAPILNHNTHLNNHTGEDLIVINGDAVNGGTAFLTQNGIGLMNSRILSTNPVTVTNNRSSVAATNSATVISISPSQSHPNHHPPLTSTHSVIYTNQLPGSTAAVAAALNGSTFSRLKAEPATVTTVDLQRHLAATANPALIPVLSTLSMPLQLTTNQSPISLQNLNQSQLVATGLTSPHQVTLTAATTSAAVPTNLVGTKTSVNNSFSSASKSQSQVAQLQSTPIPASRKNSTLFTLARSHDQSPVVSSPTALTLDNTSPLDQSSVLSASPGNTLALSHSAQLVSHSAALNSQLTLPVSSTSVSQTSRTATISFNGSGNGTPSAAPIGSKVLDYTEMREVIKNVVQEAIVEYEDEEMAFCRSLAASLRHLDRSRKDVAKLELQQVIVRHTNPNYCGNSMINHNSSNAMSMEEDSTRSVTNNSSASNSNTVSTIMSNSNGGGGNKSNSTSGSNPQVMSSSDGSPLPPTTGPRKRFKKS